MMSGLTRAGKGVTSVVATSIAAMALAVAAPATAQEEQAPDEAAKAMAAMAELFQVEPLTAEQQTRLPLAEKIINKMIPPGSLGDLMGSLYDEMLSPIMEMATQVRAADLAGPLGFDAYELALDQDQLEQAMLIIDPVRNERNARAGSVMPAIMQEMMVTMEPTMRKAMSEVYAVHFTDQELADIDGFFSTESGLSFAQKSLTMSSDPRIVAASIEAMPAMMGSLSNLEQRIEEVTSDLPAVRTFGDLTQDEQGQLAEIMGVSKEELAQRAAYAAE